LLRDLFGLTWAEADVAIGTASRLAVPEIAQARAACLILRLI